ncbi:DMT family transporter [bacterium]|nr:DMT family transporter [bacterium]
MSLHQAKINRSKGLTLALITTIMWAILPIIIKTVLRDLDPITTTWYRFCMAGGVLTIIICIRQNFPALPKSRGVLILWITACLGLVANHTVYVAGLNFLQPVAATIFIQLAPVFLLAGSLIIFREPFSRRQWGGFLVLLAGIGLFFLPELKSLASLTREFILGAVLIATAALTWAIYALSQKQLLNHYSSQQIMTVIYITGTILLFPWARPEGAFELDSARMALLIFAGINTLVAYGCFSEALDIWDASRVSAVIATIPVFTVIFMLIAQFLFPEFVDPEPLTATKLTGACVVVAGSMICALAKRSPS